MHVHYNSDLISELIYSTNIDSYAGPLVAPDLSYNSVWTRMVCRKNDDGTASRHRPLPQHIQMVIEHHRDAWVAFLGGNPGLVVLFLPR